MTNYLGCFFGVRDENGFQHAATKLRNVVGGSFFASDNVITWGRNLSFLEDPLFNRGMKKSPRTQVEAGIIWRTYIVAGLAQACKSLPGDFVEFGVLRGTTVEVVDEICGLEALDKRFYLYDVFDSAALPRNLHLPDHKANLEAEVRDRFARQPHIRIVAGLLPDSLQIDAPDRVAFAHIDLNNAEAEAAVLKWVLPRLSDRAMVVFDDYGWQDYGEQKKAIDQILEGRTTSVIELPTGQGIYINA